MLKAAALRALQEWRSKACYSESHSLQDILESWATADDYPTREMEAFAKTFAAESIDSIADAIVQQLKSDDK